MFKLCKYQNCAVCTNIKEREVFKSILKTVHPEIYICKHAAYGINSFIKNEMFVITSLWFVNNSSKGCFVRDMYTGKLIFLDKSNVTIICLKQGMECDVEPFVAEYTSTKNGS